MLAKVSLRRVISLLYILKAYLEACNDGCLKCLISPEGQSSCQICDSMRGYILKVNECEMQQIDHCRISFDVGACSLCLYNYYLTSDFKCAAVPKGTSIAIQSCNDYLNINQCLVCDFYTYERNGFCRPISKQIKKCTKYLNPTQCEICDLQLPTFEKGSCSKVTDNKFNNCMFFRHPLKCTKCKPGYGIDENYFLKNIWRPEMYQIFFLKLKFWREMYFELAMSTPVCSYKYTIENCQVLGFNETCSVCNLGYTLSPDRDRKSVV